MRFLLSVVCVIMLASFAVAVEPTPPGWYPLPPGVTGNLADVPQLFTVKPSKEAAPEVLPILDEDTVMLCSKRRSKGGACNSADCQNGNCANGSCSQVVNGTATCNGAACSQPVTQHSAQPVVTYYSTDSGGCSSGTCSGGSCGGGSRRSRR